MSTIQERTSSTDNQDFKAVSRVSKDVMDAAKKTASGTREGEQVSQSDLAKGKVLVEAINENYRRVPDSFEPKDLLKVVKEQRQAD